ncbi:GntR family transcriptional regulator [Streptomyces sp. NPDC020983]|uniref:GntR family transcriptional regulator n=1 Tax=Streptomyces sp. NPDC020983 TaxID=3365106 RepID=UPI0037922D8E
MPSDVARHRRIAADLEQRIATGEWLPGDQLPSRVALGREYKVHEQTIRLAVLLLQRRGVLESQGERRRVEVAHAVVVREFTLADADAPWPRQQVETTRHGQIIATDELALRLDINPGLRLNRETEERADAAGRSAIHVTSWWRGQRRAHASYTATVDAVLVSREQAAALRLPVDTVALRVVRTRLDDSGRPVETADLILPRDRWRVVWR